MKTDLPSPKHPPSLLPSFNLEAAESKSKSGDKWNNTSFRLYPITPSSIQIIEERGDEMKTNYQQYFQCLTIGRLPTIFVSELEMDRSRVVTSLYGKRNERKERKKSPQGTF